MNGQLVFDFALSREATIESYNVSGNELLVDMLNDVAMGRGEKQIYMWSGDSVGKTHLLQSVCHLKSNSGFQAAYLPMKTLLRSGPAVLGGFEQIPLVCVDDAHVLGGSPDWEEAFFDLINRIRESNGELLIAAGKAPEGTFILPDLVSRLTWGPVIKVTELDEEGVRAALLARAKSLGMHLPVEVVNYLLAHYPRSTSEQISCLTRLAESSLVKQRSLTIPFVRETLMND